jgi:hypothetical protein
MRSLPSQSNLLLADAYTQTEDDAECAGLGIVMMLFVLRNLGFSQDVFAIRTSGDEMVATLTLTRPSTALWKLRITMTRRFNDCGAPKRKTSVSDLTLSPKSLAQSTLSSGSPVHGQGLSVDESDLHASFSCAFSREAKLPVALEHDSSARNSSMRTDTGGDISVFEYAIEDDTCVGADSTENLFQDDIIRIGTFVICKSTDALKWT